MTIKLWGGRYVAIFRRGEAPLGYLYTWYDGHHHQFCVGPLCFAWGIE
jgi:hypothetical protein